MAELTAEDAALAALRERFPGWQIWCVRCFDGARSSVIWCAREPLLHAGTPEALAAAITCHG